MPFLPSVDDLLRDLTPAQREAVTHVEGPLLIVAGPGSGKTRVITRRVAYLLSQGVGAHRILAITFTNKAAGEMRERIQALVPGTGAWISTFHSLGVRLLRQYADRLGLERNFTLYDQDDRVRMVKAALATTDVDPNRFTPEALQGAISKAKNQLLLPEAYAATAKDFFTQAAAHVYGAYERKMREANALDFDDLLLWPALALKNDPEMRAELDARFQHVLVDEYQDTNKAQYAIARALSVDYPNLCVVGDPDQSIYRWRGADIKNILDFERDFADARVITLGQNFRSTRTILAAADSVIRNNRQRKPKDLTTPNPEGEPVRVLQFETGLDEAEQVARRIRARVDAGLGRFRDVAVFLRLNALSRNLESAFIRQRVPFQIVRGLAFFERKENKDVLAYLRLLLNPRDDLSFLRVVNEPARGIGKVSLEHLAQYAQPRELPLLAAAAQVDKVPAIKGKASTGLRSFALIMAELAKEVDLPPDELIARVLDRSGYRKMLQKSSDPEDQERLANIEELVTAARQFRAEDENRTLADFLENITLASDVDGWDAEQDCVAVMTLHAAKGLEFPVVYMLACEQGILPHERSLTKDEDVEEERRLAFVGMTRARQELHLCHARMREFRGRFNYAVPSMFLEELPSAGVAHEDLSMTGSGRPRVEEMWRSGGPSPARQGWRDAGFDDFRSRAPAAKPEAAAAGSALAEDDYREGMVVEHDTYGRGMITAVNGHGILRKVKIRFGSGERTFIAAKAKLRIVR